VAEDGSLQIFVVVGHRQLHPAEALRLQEAKQLLVARLAVSATVKLIISRNTLDSAIPWPIAPPLTPWYRPCVHRLYPPVPTLLESPYLPSELTQFLPLEREESLALTDVDLVLPDTAPQGDSLMPILRSSTIFGIDFFSEGALDLESLPLELRWVVRCWSRHMDPLSVDSSSPRL
jgi:hypothetical protein